MVRAAVFAETGGPLEVVDVETLGPSNGEVRVRIRATGVCHSDLSGWNGTLPQPAPCVLGHEGAGEVVAVGDDVHDLEPGDRVIVAWVPPCGNCRPCRRREPHLCVTHTVTSMTNPRFLRGETPYFGFAGIGTFAEEVTIPESAAIKVGGDVPFTVGALIGCGVMTGVGAALNVARVEPGSSVAVIGCGGVGISAIQGARVAGAAEIAAVDTAPEKLDWARRFGATHAVGPEDLEGVRHDVTAGEGFDCVFEAVGVGATIRQAYDLARRGGTVVVVGAGSPTDEVSFNAFELFYMDRVLRGCVYGGADVTRDFDRVLRLWRAGRLDLEGMITRSVALDDVAAAFEAMQRGEVIRQVIELD